MDEVSTEAALREELSERIKTVTVEELPAFIEDVMGRDNTYGSLCVALGSIAAAAAMACNKHSGASGGITGFQAGAVFWEFARAWGSPSIGKCGARFLNYDHLLFPQYSETFTSISSDTLEIVREQAAKKIAETPSIAHPEVVAHWQSIVDGDVPFGLQVTT